MVIMVTMVVVMVGVVVVVIVVMVVGLPVQEVKPSKRFSDHQKYDLRRNCRVLVPSLFCFLPGERSSMPHHTLLLCCAVLARG